MYRVCIAMAVVFKLCAWRELFSEKNVISVSIDAMRRNTDTEISKLETVSIAEPLQNRQHAQNR